MGKFWRGYFPSLLSLFLNLAIFGLNIVVNLFEYMVVIKMIFLSVSDLLIGIEVFG